MSKGAFKLQFHPHQVAAIRFRGSVDDLLLARAVDECLSREFCWLVMDFTEASQANSTAISRLVQQRDAVHTKGGRLVFVEPAGSVGIVFNMMGLRDTFTTYSTIDDAVRDLISQSSGAHRLEF